MSTVETENIGVVCEWINIQKTTIMFVSKSIQCIAAGCVIVVLLMKTSVAVVAVGNIRVLLLKCKTAN